MLRLAQFLNLRPGEGRLVSLLLVLSFLTGGAIVFSDIAGNALFLSLFGTDALPLIYITTAFVSPIAGLSFTYLQRRFSFTRVVIGFNGALFLLLAAILVGLWLTGGASWLVFLALFWYRFYYVLGLLLFWGLAGRVLDLRQGKRLFGLISTGESLSRTIGYFSTSILVTVIGVTNLLLIAAVCVALALVIIRLIGRSAALPTAAADPGAPIRWERPSRYMQLIWLVGALASFTYALVDFAFAGQVSSQAPNATELAVLLGLFYGVLNGARVLVRPLSGQFINRFGLAVALLTLPVVGVLGGGAIIAAGLGTLAFWATLAVRFADGLIRSAIYRPAVQVLYQPLRPDQRISTQAILESVLDPVLQGLSGLLLLLLVAFGGQAAGVALLVGSLLWLAGTVVLNRDYLKILRSALARRLVSGASLDLNDPESLKLVEATLHSTRPNEVIYALELLAQSRPELLTELVPPLLHNPDSTVRQAAIKLIGSRNLAIEPQLLAQALERESDPAIRADAARALCAVAEDEAVDTVTPLLNDPDGEVRTAAMAGLLRNGGVAGVLAAGPALLAQLHAPLAAERAAGARVLARVAAPTFARNLAPLLNDPEVSVRRAALLAAGKINSPRLWPLVIAALDDPTTYRSAGAALVSGGEAALSAMAQVLQTNPVPHRAARIIQVCGRIGGPLVIDLLKPYLAAGDPELRRAAVLSLERSGYQASRAERTVVRQAIMVEGQRTAWLLAAKADLSLPGTTPLSRALDLELLRCRERLTYLLTFIYDREAMRLARQNLLQATAEKRAFALELIDAQVERDLRGTVVALLDEISDALCLQQLQPLYPQQPVGKEARLQQLLNLPSFPVSNWTARCVAYTLRRIHTQAQDEASQREDELIERTMLLRQVPMFDATTDDILVDVAGSLDELAVPAHTLLVQQGEAGDCMYLIVEGEVEVHDRGAVLNRLGPGTVLGELALLDGSPRLASATTRSAVRLFRLDRERFSELLDEYPAIARALLRVLARRLRASVRDLAEARQQLAAVQQTLVAETA
jgi:ATP:ADP antiporter, AAA family